jgi:sulfhydrogenase subunit beta (sulfur reductase)
MQAYKLGLVESLRVHLAKTRHLYEVRVDAKGGQHWQAVAGTEQTAFAILSEPPTFSAKSFFFAEREVLFRFSGGSFYSTLPTVQAQVLFGVQACDLQAIAYQDQFFAQDRHYQLRRSATLLVGIDCLQSCSGGFCSVVNSGPQVQRQQADLILLPPDSGRSEWLVLVASAAGAEALAGLELPAADEGWQAARDAASLRLAEQQGPQQALRDGIAAMQAGNVDAQVWDDLGLHCLGCSGCSTVCPTCSCFAPLETPAAHHSIEHERVWDSCLYAGFQREAGGQNPSARAGARVQRFWQHKFGTDFQQRFGQYGCVGCGRCDQVCPGAIGIHGVMNKVGL